MRYAAAMFLAVTLALAGIVLGLGFIGLGVYFLWVRRPYSRLLRQAGVEVVETYRGWRKGEVWEVLVSVGSQTEKHWVEAADLGRFMFQRAMGRFYERDKVKALAIEAEAAEAVGDSLAYEWIVSPNKRVMTVDKKPRTDFSSSRREILSKAEEMMSAAVVLRARALESAS